MIANGYKGDEPKPVGDGEWQSSKRVAEPGSSLTRLRDFNSYHHVSANERTCHYRNDRRRTRYWTLGEGALHKEFMFLALRWIESRKRQKHVVTSLRSPWKVSSWSQCITQSRLKIIFQAIMMALFSIGKSTCWTSGRRGALNEIL